MVKNVALIWVSLQAGITSEQAIIRETGVNYFSVKSLLPLVRSLDFDQVKALVDRAADTDISLKTGGYKYSAEYQGELIALAERLVMACYSE